MSNLKLGVCDAKGCQFAVDHWHYSRSLPPPPKVNLGVWEDGEVKGAVIFPRGASSNLLKPYSLKITEGAELVRVALKNHDAPMSRILAIAVRLLRKQCPGLRVLVSFAEPAEGHMEYVRRPIGSTWVNSVSWRPNDTSDWRFKRYQLNQGSRCSSLACFCSPETPEGDHDGSSTEYGQVVIN